MEELYKKFNFPSLDKFRQILKSNNINATIKEVKDFISKKSVTQVHKPITNVKEKQKFIIALSPYEMLQIDLLDYQKYSHQNKGYNFILIGVDIFSRKAYAALLKNKTPDSVLKGFEEFDIEPMSVYHDSGKEYLGVFLKYLDDNGIVNLHAEIGDHNSLGVIDRFSRTIKTQIAKYMTANDTVKYCDEVTNLIDVYNESPHFSLGNLTPDSVFTDKKNLQLVTKINMEKMKFNKSIDQKNNIKVGDNVRVKNKKTLFQKGYDITYSKEIHKVESINVNSAVLNDGTKHKIKDLLVVDDTMPPSITTTNKDIVEKEIKVNRKLKKVGIVPDAEIGEKRIRKAPVVFDL